MKFINRNIHWILLLLLILFVASSLIRPFYISTSSWDLNQTSGWGWDVSALTWWVVFNPIPLIVIMSLGYWLLKIFKSSRCPSLVR